MTGRNEEVSPIRREKSPMFGEVPMSAAADVKEMRELCGEIADRLAGKRSAVKDRTQSLVDRLGFEWNRAFELLCGKARRIDSYEKDNARQLLADLKRAEQRQRELDHLGWLECEIARHRASGEELRGAHVDGLEHLLRVARGADSAVALPVETDFTD